MSSGMLPCAPAVRGCRRPPRLGLELVLGVAGAAGAGVAWLVWPFSECVGKHPARPGPGVVIGPRRTGSGSPYAWQQSDLPHWLRDAPPTATSPARTRVALTVLVIAMAALLVAFIVAATM